MGCSGARHRSLFWSWVMLLCCGFHLDSAGLAYTLPGGLIDRYSSIAASGRMCVPPLQPLTFYKATLTPLSVQGIKVCEPSVTRRSVPMYSSYDVDSTTDLWNDGFTEKCHDWKEPSHNGNPSGFSTGTRKRSRARVSLVRGSGLLWINGRRGEEYMQGHPFWLLNCRGPLLEVRAEGSFDIYAEVKGGGLGGQSGAIMLAVARELSRQLPETRSVLRQGGFLTVDSRRVERKKFGFKKARKRPQYSKR